MTYHKSLLDTIRLLKNRRDQIDRVIVAIEDYGTPVRYPLFEAKHVQNKTKTEVAAPVTTKDVSEE